MDFDLTKEEKSAIASLKRLAKKWPEGLWLFSAGSLHVMRQGPNGHAHLAHDGVDPDYIVDTINGIDHDGGDW